jgi:hypothetical protein
VVERRELSAVERAEVVYCAEVVVVSEAYLQGGSSEREDAIVIGHPAVGNETEGAGDEVRVLELELGLGLRVLAVRTIRGYEGRSIWGSSASCRNPVQVERSVARDVASRTSFSGGRHPFRLYMRYQWARDLGGNGRTYPIRHEPIHQIVLLDDLIRTEVVRISILLQLAEGEGL